jgi:hypothetical protein
MSDEFKVHLLNEYGLAKAADVAHVFSEALRFLDALIPQGRERALVVTKMQEACFFAKRAVALQPDNQLNPAPNSLGIGSYGESQ